MSDKGDYDSDSSLSSAKTDIKVVKMARKISDNYADNIEPREVLQTPNTSQKATSNIRLRRKYRSWMNTDGSIPPVKTKQPPHTKSDGENDTPNTESDSVKKRRSRAPINRSVNDNKLRSESAYMEYYNGRKYKAVNGWKIPLEIKCREIGTECATFRWLHNKNAVMLGGKLTSTNLAIAIIGAISTVSVLVDYITNNYYKDVMWTDPVMKLITFLLTLTVTIISIIQRTYNFMQKIEFHRNAERRHTWLFYDIQSQLQKNPKDRTTGYDYFKWITHELNSIADSNDIDDDVIKEFYKTFQDTKIPGLDTMNQLQVYMEDEDDSSSKNAKLGSDQNIAPSNSIVDLNKIATARSMDHVVIDIDTINNQPGTTASSSLPSVSTSPNQSPNYSPSPSTNPMNTSIENVGTDVSLKKSGGFVGRRSSAEMNLTPKNRRIDDNYVRQFREQRDMNMLNLATNTNTSRFYSDEQEHRLHNPEMMSYEMSRMKSVED